MTWGDDQVVRPQIKTTLALLREGETAFQELTATSDDAELVDKLAGLDKNPLRSIVFERVIAARYGPALPKAEPPTRSPAESFHD